MKLRIAGTFLTLLAAGVAVGQPSDQPAGDPPSRVARLNYLQGQVSFRPGSVDEWTPATLNYPIYNGDHLWADAASQAELHIGSTAIRLGSETALAMLNLDDRMVQLSLTGGILNVRLRALGEGESFEIDTPNSAVTLLRPGDYRVQVDEAAGVTNVIVHGGDTEINGGGRSFTVHAREMASMTGIDDTFSNVISAERGFDQFDRWCQDRDRREDQSESVRYVGREMNGYEDLDANGSWSQEPEYGWVWRPRVVAADWAPYRYGHWAWVEPWGWTWVDDAPWGFAPFHYGRWAYHRGYWVWVPGTFVARPVYAPALVAFVGGGGFSAAIAFGGGGGVAWFPLGPREVYRPAYHVSEVYVRQVNITHVNVTNINVTNVTYVNRTYVTAVNHETFVGARPVHTAVVRVSPDVAMRAQVVGYAAPVAPERVSVIGRATVVGRVAAPPPRYVERTVVVRHAPPPPPVSFAAKRDALMVNPGRPVDPQVNESLRRNDRFQRPPMVRSATPGANPVPSTYQPRQPIQQQPQQMQQPIRTGPPMTREPVQRQQEQQQSQQPPQRDDRPNFRQQQQQPQQPQQVQQPAMTVTRPHDPVPQQPNPQAPSNAERRRIPEQHDIPVQQPRREIQPQPQPQNQAQPEHPRGEQRQEVREQRKNDRKSEHKDERKEEKKQ
jgi:hypothetical protein